MIPQEIMDNLSWCGWKYEIRGDKRTKVPYDLKTGKRAESNNPETFRPYCYVEEQEFTGDYNGFGVRVDNGYCAIDIDKCIKDGEMSDLASDLCNTLNSYTELSPSKSGIRIICKADIPQYDRQRYYIKNDKLGLEIYATGASNRFVTITGNTLYNYPVREATDDILKILDRYMLRKAKTTRMTDDELIAKAMKQDAFVKLFRDGNLSAHNNDHSSADLALCNMLAFWTGKDAARIDELFRRSALYRPEKWNRDDYRKWTIDKAISDCTNTYSAEVPMDIWNKLVVRTPLNMGKWQINTKNGVHCYLPPKKGEELPELSVICSNPVVPAAYLENRTTGQQRVELHYIDGGKQRSIVCDKEVVYSKSKVVALANNGIPVTSNTASQFVQYMADMEQLNSDVIPRYASTSAMGWTEEYTPSRSGFMPYDDSLVFDGEQENYQLYNSITQEGNYDEWLNHVAPLRNISLPLRLLMAASFASPLIGICNVLPFVCHLWGASGKGKSVALMVAMSVWGNPRMGELVKTMNMTNAAMMSSAAFLNDLPFAGDELQTIKDNDMRYDKLIMQITEGIERGRMYYNKNLPTRSWRCAFLFTGEEPCTSDTSGGGTKNRVFEVNYTDKIIPNGNETVSIITNNYGHAGVAYIDYVAANKERVRAMYSDYLSQILSSTDCSDKQAMVGALILVGDTLASEVIFGDKPLTVDDVAPYLKSESEVLTHERAYDALIAWIAQNGNRFNPLQNYGEVWGKESGDGTMYIIASRLEKALQEMHFSFDALKKPWADKGVLIMYQNKYKKKKSINGVATYVVEIKMPEVDFEEVDRTKVPFSSTS